MLTDRQRNILDFIQREQREKGITPSTREIQSHFGFASQTSVMQYIAALERKGFLDRHARKARALITPAMKVRITDVPIYGQIPAGMSALTEQTIEGHVSLDMRSANVSKNRGTFALRVRGDSMIGAHIVDGDIVILEDSKEVHSGDIVAALKTNTEKGTGRVFCNTHPGGPDRFGKMADGDLTDIATYIHTLPPVKNGPFKCVQ